MSITGQPRTHPSPNPTSYDKLISKCQCWVRRRVGATYDLMLKVIIVFVWLVFWFCYYALSDWLSKFSPFSEPITRETYWISREVCSRAFPALGICCICKTWLVHPAVHICRDWLVHYFVVVIFMTLNMETALHFFFHVVTYLESLKWRLFTDYTWKQQKRCHYNNQSIRG